MLNVGRCGAVPSRTDARTINYKAVHSALDARAALRTPAFFHDTRPQGNRWQILGNDHYGCCTFAGIARIMINNAKRRGQVCDITDKAVIKAYLDYNDGQDVGAMPINALTYMRNIGINGWKVLAFARVDTHDLFERQSAMMTFGSLYVAAALPVRLDDDRDLRWELTPMPLRTSRDEPRSMGGHAYPVFGFQRGEEFTVPWDQEVIEEAAWTEYYREESWVFSDNHETDPVILDVMTAQLAAIKAA